MKTPISDFIDGYRGRAPLRLHMPGHKGLGETESMDITEIAGADVLYRSHGIIRASEENAAKLFGSARTVYSAEGSSLCVRGMLYLALLQARKQNRPPLILAGRNAHRSLMTACALLDCGVEWLFGTDRTTCLLSPEEVEAALKRREGGVAAVYLTSPDYLGNRADIRGIARVCRKYGVPLLVDNAHGAYLRFLPEDLHPLTLGADMTCDSAHKTLPVLTGGAYLHISAKAPCLFREQAERALSLFASTSPSYLILRSLDRANAVLAGEYRTRLEIFSRETALLKQRLRDHGYTLRGDEPLKITVAAKAFGYTGDELHALLRKDNLECEFSDPDYLVMMVTPETGAEGLRRMEEALLSIRRREPAGGDPPPLPRPEQVLSIREAMLADSERVPREEGLGRILADAAVSCPPAVPIVVCGERISREAIACFRYYGEPESLLCVREEGRP